MYPEEYIEFLVHFHGDRDYFECHEVLEEYWKKVDIHNKKSIWVGFILLAVANYHHRRKNYSGANKTLTKAIIIFEENHEQLALLAIDGHKLGKLLHNHLQEIIATKHYSSYNLPIFDQTLLLNCKQISAQKNLPWGKSSNLKNKELIHRHCRRDRSEVIQERLDAFKKRKK